MSIIQMMDSTKSGKVIYVVASTVLIFGCVAGISYSLDGIVALTAESSILLTPFVGFFSLLLLILKPDRYVVEAYVTSKIRQRSELQDIKIRMAASLLYAKPWQSAQREADTIEESLRFSIGRALRSREFKDQIDNYKQSLWLILLMPFTFILMLALYQMPITILSVWPVIVVALVGLFGMSVGATFAYLLLMDNRKTPSRIIEYVFARWFQEEVSTDINRRDTGFGMKSPSRAYLSAALEIVAPAIDLVIRGDWKGFDREKRNLSQLIGIPNPEELSWGLVNSYLLFLKWIVADLHGPNSKRVDICLKNASLQITDSILVLDKNRKDGFSVEEKDVAQTLKHIASWSRDGNSILDFRVGFYGFLNKKVFEQLTDLSIETLQEFPFTINQKKIEATPTNQHREERLAWSLVAAAEEGLLDIPDTLRVASGWGIDPAAIIAAIGPSTAKVTMEKDVGWTTDQIRTVLPTIATMMDNIDLEAMRTNLASLAQKEGDDKIRKLVQQMDHDIRNTPKTKQIAERLRVLFPFYY